jgi:lipopolysaccharide/colanic/teichoic acid biosynthesis glycosyltransferase
MASIVAVLALKRDSKPEAYVSQKRVGAVEKVIKRFKLRS